MKLSRLVLFFCILMSCRVHADEWIGPYTVKYVESSAAGVYFMEDWAGFGQYSSTYSCNKASVWFPSSALSDSVLARILSTGLTAQATSARVKFLVNGCNGYLTARAIAIDPNF
jgi:hypothetical protein